jgi:nucleoside-diphosphate-sugar epimerase
MTIGGGITSFVTNAAGFVGTELVKVLVAGGHQVIGLVPSVEAAHRVRQAGATAVVGELSKPGQWQDEAGTEWVFHIPPQPLLHEARGSRRHAASLMRERVSMDANLLDAVANGTTRRVVYVADSSCYGITGPRPITEDAPLRPGNSGRCLGPALDRLDGYLVAGLPVVTGLPGWVYGNGAWFRERILEPVLSRRRVLQFGAGRNWISPIHVHDCARALVHLAERGEPGSRYFLVNSDPIQVQEFAETFARIAERPLKVRRLPYAAAQILGRTAPADCIEGDMVFSNIRLRGTGFHFNYPTLEDGLQEIVGTIEVTP